MYVSFWGWACEILGRIRLAREDALVEDVPGVVCSVKIVVSRAIQA